MKTIQTITILCLLLLVSGLITPTPALAAPTDVTVSGRQILVNGEPFEIRGVGYAPTPIGMGPDWAPHGDYFTADYSDIYTRDLLNLRRMGANTVRLWGWGPTADHTAFLDAAYNNNHNPIYVVATYWINSGQDLTNAAVRQTIKDEFVAMVAAHKNHPAILMWQIGNELNGSWMYGNPPQLFSLIDEMAAAAHAEEGAHYHPVSTPLADWNLLPTIQERDAEVPNLDVWSIQIYRGSTFGSLFADYAALSDKPLFVSEYGIDAYDDVHGAEYASVGPDYQAQYAVSLWNEIAASEICIGGSIMAYSDEWWKGQSGQSDHAGCPDHDPWAHSACGYANGAHPDGYANEEWWGIMRTVNNGAGPDILQPRGAYTALQALWKQPLELKTYLPGVLR